MRTVIAARSLLYRVDYDVAVIIEVKVRTTVVIATAPPSKRDHFVISRPRGEGVVAGMVTQQSAAVNDKVHERLFHFGHGGFPVAVLVVQNDGQVAVGGGEIGGEP